MFRPCFAPGRLVPRCQAVSWEVDALTIIRAFGADPDVLDEDYRSLIAACSDLLSCPVVEIVVWRPTLQDLPSANVRSRDLLLGRTEGDRVIAFKRCRRVQDYIDRELFIARLRRTFSINDYPIALQTGLRLRDGFTRSNLSEISDWESTPFILVDFGQVGARARLHGKHNPNQSCTERGCLQPDRIPDVVGFFRQFGELAAFDYLIGSPDRHGANYVFDTLTATLYSVDHEEGPYKEPGIRVPSDKSIQEIVRTAKFYREALPADVGSACRQAFDDSFISKWRYVSDHRTPLRKVGTPDSQFIIGRLDGENPIHVAKSINF